MASRLYRLSVICQSRGESVARPEGLEPSTPGLEGRCSIQLSYGRVSQLLSRSARSKPTHEPSRWSDARRVSSRGYYFASPVRTCVRKFATWAASAGHVRSRAGGPSTSNAGHPDLSPFAGTPLAIGGFRLTHGPAATQPTAQLVEQLVLLPRQVVRRPLVTQRFRGAYREKIVRERRADLVHLTRHEAAKV
jgi:hypothetical protein